MNPTTPDALANLRGYHLPDPVSWWPPAPGWWLLAVLVLATLVVISLLLWRRYRNRAALREALIELERLDHQQAATDPAGFARKLSRLLRRYALTRFPRNKVAGLTGNDWLGFLDAHGGGTTFCEGAGRLLIEAPYRSAGDPPALLELAQLARQWLLHNRGTRT
ncbi:MAG: DUF4381 domain-containing protein [Candidatus Thiodiazotropha sp.]|jgi:hypothetical protein